MRKFWSIFLGFTMLLSCTSLKSQSAHADITLPQDPWQSCSIAPAQFCIEEVSINPNDRGPIQLTWVPSGDPRLLSSTNVEGVVPGRTLPGGWITNGSGLDGNGYSALYLEVKPANKFVPWIFANVLPVLVRSGETFIAAQASNLAFPIDLNESIEISYKLRVAEFRNGVTFGVGTDVQVTSNYNQTLGTITISGYPVRVPLASNINECSGLSGKTISNVRQLQSFFVPQNDSLGFGIEGLSGNLYVGSNGICKLSTPTWDRETKRFRYFSSAPRLSTDGTQINLGFYRVVIPIVDAKLLWGLDRPSDASTALVVNISTSTSGSLAATKSVSVRGQNIIIDVNGFEFPDVNLDIALNPKFTSATLQSSLTSSPSPSPMSSISALQRPAPKKITITCMKGAVKKKVSGSKPKCPKGYRKI